MPKPGKFLFLLIICLFFSCLEPAAGETIFCVLREDVDSPSELSSDDSLKISLPEIIGLPVEIVPVEVHRKDCRKNYSYTEPLSPIADNHPEKYLAISRIILPALNSTQIGYPFHAFW